MEPDRNAADGAVPRAFADPRRRGVRMVMLLLAVVFVAVVVASLLPMRDAQKSAAPAPARAMPGMKMPSTSQPSPGR